MELSITKIIMARMTAGLTQAEVARRCGWSRQHQNQIEAGKSRPSSEALGKLAEVLGVKDPGAFYI